MSQKTALIAGSRAEAKSWMALGERIAENAERIVGPVYCLGLCAELHDFPNGKRMGRRVDRHLDGCAYIESVGDPVSDTGSDYDLSGKEQADLRVIACLFLALECADEAESLSQGDRR